MLQDSVRVEPVEEIISGQVKGRDDLLRVSHQLGVEVTGEATEVVTVDVEEGFFKCVNLAKRGREGGREKVLS